MKIPGVIRILITVLLLVFSSAGAQQKYAAPGRDTQNSLRRFLQSLDDNKTARYLVAFADLDDDGQPEAIAYLISPNWCGSGGCSMFVLKQNGNTWETVTETSITQRPIRVLTDTSHGWHSLGVWVQGGGIQPGYEAELRFDGKTYPENPSVLPARRLKKNRGRSFDIPIATPKTFIWRGMKNLCNLTHPAPFPAFLPAKLIFSLAT